VADRIIIEGQFSYTPDVTFAGASNATIAAAQRLFGASAAAACRAAFQARGFIS
jgi:Zn-dependent metalloprotease